MGLCPVYSVHFSEKDTWYEGISNVDLIGSYKAVLSQEQWNSLETLIAESDKLNTRYKSTNNLDLPTTYLRILHNSALKEISIYGRTPKEITPYFNQLTELIETLNWKQKE